MCPYITAINPQKGTPNFVGTLSNSGAPLCLQPRSLMTGTEKDPQLSPDMKHTFRGFPKMGYVTPNNGESNGK